MTGAERWHGKVALVTGASSGIGEAIARALGGAGLKVAVAARRAERLATLERELQAQGASAMAVPCDVEDEAQVARMFDAVRKQWGPLDVLVNNAGTGPMATFAEGTTEQLRETLAVNVLGYAVCMRRALKEMEAKEEALILNIVSIYARREQVPNFSFYQASKYAVLALTNTVRAELHTQRSSIRLAMISPGMTATEFREQATGGRLKRETYFKDFHPLLPEDIAQAAMYILSTPPYVQVHDILLSPMGQGL